MKVHSTTTAKAESNREAEIVRNRTAEDLPKTPITECTADTSTFFTPDPEKQPSTSQTRKSRPKSVQKEHNITELPTTSNIPVSNLAKLWKSDMNVSWQNNKQQTQHLQSKHAYHNPKNQQHQVPPSSTNSLAIRSRN